MRWYDRLVGMIRESKVPLQPSVTVILPVYNVERYVVEAIESVCRQTYSRIELVAIDDGSTDATPEILDRHVVDAAKDGIAMTAVHQKNQGVGAARNAGLERSSGDYIAFLDADDRWRPLLLERLVDHLERHPELDAAFPCYCYIDEDGSELGIHSQPSRRRYGLEDIFKNNPIHSSTGVVVRRDALLRVNGSDETLQGCVDLDLWLRLAAQRPQSIGCVHEILADYRRRDGQITSDWRRMEQNWETVFERAVKVHPERLMPLVAEARARHQIYWSALAYENKDYSASRRHIASAWKLAAPKLITDSRAWIRAVAGVASLLPAPAHRFLGQSFNAVRSRLGIHFS